MQSRLPHLNHHYLTYYVSHFSLGGNLNWGFTTWGLGIHYLGNSEWGFTTWGIVNGDSLLGEWGMWNGEWEIHILHLLYTYITTTLEYVNNYLWEFCIGCSNLRPPTFWILDIWIMIDKSVIHYRV